MATEMRATFARALDLKPVSVQGRELGRCSACGASAEIDPGTGSWWHLESRYCTDPTSAFLTQDEYDFLQDTDKLVQELFIDAKKMGQQLDEHRENMAFLARHREEKIARNLRWARIGLIVACIGFLLQVIAQILRLTG